MTHEIWVGYDVWDGNYPCYYEVQKPWTANRKVVCVKVKPYTYDRENEEEVFDESKFYNEEMNRDVFCRYAEIKPSEAVFPEYEPDLTSKYDIADAMRNRDSWNNAHCKALCKLAGMEKEWAEADGENFEEVVEEAADKLGVSIY